MLTRDFDFELPATAIAQEALPRGESRLLVLDDGREPRHGRIRDLPGLLESGDLLVVNDTRVIPARLFGRRPSGGRVELLLVEKVTAVEWDALVKPARRARPGTRLRLDAVDREGGVPEVEVLRRGEDGRHRLRFDSPVDPHLERIGHVPLPPYIKRPDTERDRSRYQTVYAKKDGAIAAPTAGLHFTEELLETLRSRGVERASVTLHVGIGTFKPVTAELVQEHRMDAERWEVPEATAEAVRRTRDRGGRVVAVGTTVVRTLESAALAGGGTVRAGEGATELFIRPGFQFQAVDRLLTNFHLPRSTLLMLVSALAGRERVLAAYREAVEQGYRFYSYGDAMLVDRSAVSSVQEASGVGRQAP
jgi:S-adenosylmethionine:tRNA ribosyltransferase-isomerase